MVPITICPDNSFGNYINIKDLSWDDFLDDNYYNYNPSDIKDLHIHLHLDKKKVDPLLFIEFYGNNVISNFVNTLIDIPYSHD